MSLSSVYHRAVSNEYIHLVLKIRKRFSIIAVYRNELGVVEELKL